MKIEMAHLSVGDYSQGTMAPDLISCDHCGIVAENTPRFGWKRWTEVTHNDEPFPLFSSEDGTTRVVRHHCPQAVQMNEWVETGLVNMVAPEEAVTYEDWE